MRILISFLIILTGFSLILASRLYGRIRQLERRAKSAESPESRIRSVTQLDDGSVPDVPFPEISPRRGRTVLNFGVSEMKQSGQDTDLRL